MANKNPKTENLIPFNELSKEALKEITKKGGVKSALVRQERKRLKDELLYLLASKDKTGKTMQTKICLSLINEAIRGKVQAYQAIEASIGEKPTDTIAQHITGEIDEKTINKVMDKLKEL